LFDGQNKNATIMEHVRACFFPHFLTRSIIVAFPPNQAVSIKNKKADFIAQPFYFSNQ
jgi:hypothetical protein